MKKIAKTAVRQFTLVELLVAMAVFSVLLVVSMQIFSGAQKLWVRSEQKNSTFANARVTMEFIASRIQTMGYSVEMPFELNDRIASSNAYKSIFFASSMPMERRQENSDDNLDTYPYRILAFYWNDNTASSNYGKLYMLVYSDKGRRTFSGNFPPFASTEEYNSCLNNIYNAVLGSGSGSLRTIAAKDDSAKSDEEKADCLEIANFITSFKLIPYKLNTSASGIEPMTGTRINQMPYLMEIEISMLDTQANFDAWKEADAEGKKAIETEFGYTFRRAVLLNDRRI